MQTAHSIQGKTREFVIFFYGCQKYFLLVFVYLKTLSIQHTCESLSVHKLLDKMNSICYKVFDLVDQLYL